jgi:hypothetical protein
MSDGTSLRLQVGLPFRQADEDKMSKRIKDEEALAKRKLDLQLDRELEDTFPASDALKITRTPHDTSSTRSDRAIRERQGLNSARSAGKGN